MPVLLQVNFVPGPGQASQSQADKLASARHIAGLPGLAWKVWIQDPGSNTRGGIYLFADLASAQAWGDSQLRPRLEQGGATGISIRYFDVNEEPSRITRAPLDRVPEPA